MQAQAILAAHRVEAPVDFTVKSDPERWAQAFGGIVLATGSVRVERLAAAVADLPGFADGEWWVQDAAASLPARLLGDVAGQRVADLCAAPGGKTAQLALAGAEVSALDSSKNRLKRLDENLERLRLPARTVEADVLKYAPETPFDAVLLDAPCSSTGTVRRHPDVPWTKAPEDIAKLADLQSRLLASAVPMVKPGGRIVFSNCSLDPVEGELLVAAFLAEHPDVVLDPVRSGELPGADSFVAAERRDPHHASRSRSRQAGDFRARRLLCGAVFAAALKTAAARKHIFTLAPRIYSTNVRRGFGTVGGDFWRALRAIPRVCGRWWRASCGDARGAGCAPGRSIIGATKAARLSAY